MKTTPFWLDDFPRPADLPVAPLPDAVDVAVIGGGYTGLGAAFALAKAGQRVAVLEQGQIGHGASAMNGGQAGPDVKLGIRKAFQKYGPELGREIWQATLESVALLEQTLQAEKIEADYTPNGNLAAAVKPAHYAAFAHEIEWFAKTLHYEPFELIPPEQMRRELGTDIYHGGLVEHCGGGIHPAKYLFGLARAAAKAGALLCENAGVQRLERGGGFTLTTGQGPLNAEAVLLATNGYTGPLVKDIQRGVFTVGSYMVTTEPLPPALQQELIPYNRVVYDTKNFLNYFRLMPDGRLSIGGRNNLSPNLDVVDSAKILGARLVEIFPQLTGYPITHTWTGRLGITFDLMPHLGQIDGVYYAYGYGGHGVALSAWLGQEAAALMTGIKKRSPFADIPHQKSVFYRGDAWFLPLAASYYRFWDWVG